MPAHVARVVCASCALAGFTVNDYLHDPQTAPGWNEKLPTLTTNTYQVRGKPSVL